MQLSQSLAFKRRIQQILLILVDGLLIYLSFVFSRYLRFTVLDFSIFINTTLLIIFAIIFAFNYVFGLYEPLHWRARVFSPPRTILSLLFSLAVITLLIYFIGANAENFTGRGVLVSSLVVYSVSSLIFRYIFEKANKKQVAKEKWILICDEAHHDIFQKENKKNSLPGTFIWIPIKDISQNLNILNEVSLKSWTGLIVEGSVDSSLTEQLMDMKLSGQAVYSFQTFYEVYWQKLPVKTLSASWFTFSDGFSILQNRVSMKIKRFGDIVLSLILLFLTAPLTALFWSLIKLESKGDGFYSQIRVGENGRHFKIWKLRSMRTNAEAAGAQWAAKNDSRVTAIGKFIRKTRIDELPQAINILKGDMSFIGPRPERPEFTEELKKKIPFYDLRHLLKPGLTGWAQVMYPYGANEEDAIEKLEYELYYIKNYSLWRDIVILVKTFLVVITGKGR